MDFSPIPNGNKVIGIGSIVALIFVGGTVVSMYLNSLNIRKTKLEIERLEIEKAEKDKASQ